MAKPPYLRTYSLLHSGCAPLQQLQRANDGNYKPTSCHGASPEVGTGRREGRLVATNRNNTGATSSHQHYEKVAWRPLAHHLLPTKARYPGPLFPTPSSRAQYACHGLHASDSAGEKMVVSHTGNPHTYQRLCLLRSRYTQDKGRSFSSLSAQRRENLSITPSPNCSTMRKLATAAQTPNTTPPRRRHEVSSLSPSFPARQWNHRVPEWSARATPHTPSGTPDGLHDDPEDNCPKLLTISRSRTQHIQTRRISRQSLAITAHDTPSLTISHYVHDIRAGNPARKLTNHRRAGYYRLQARPDWLHGPVLTDCFDATPHQVGARAWVRLRRTEGRTPRLGGSSATRRPCTSAPSLSPRLQSTVSRTSGPAAPKHIKSAI